MQNHNLKLLAFSDNKLVINDRANYFFLLLYVLQSQNNRP